MGRSQRDKGKRGEKELAAILSDWLGVKINRNLGQERDSGSDVTTGRVRWEVKRVEALRIMDWCKQVEAASSAGDIPIVAFRQDGQEWRCVIRLTDLLPLLREEVE
jgi:hypothetical protein